jgi:DNA mismatch repair protein MutS
MAQSGLYVPCSTFRYKPYTSIFSRILGNDNIFKGLSTFAVEMSELRIILKMANENSLVLGDELCSGTEIESALSLFSAGLIELHSKRSTFLFATHFHEITKYEEIQELENLGLKHMSVHYDKATNNLIYDRILKDGQGSRMYGLEVCKSLYMEESFLELAYSFRNKYFPDKKGELQHSPSYYNKKKIRGICQMCKSEIAEETHHLSPQKDANEQGYIGSFHKNHKANLASVCEKCHDKLHETDSTVKIKKSINGYIFE